VQRSACRRDGRAGSSVCLAGVRREALVTAETLRFR
jgi:hypothetical protein